MALTPNQVQLLEIALVAAAKATASPLIMMQEGAVKLAILQALLDSGETVREGSHRPKEDWLLKLSNNRLSATLTPRTGSGKIHPDIRVEPDLLVLELKVFAECGTKDNFDRSPIKKADGTDKSFNSFLWDLARVREGTAHAAMVVSAARHYDAARGFAWDKRGRNSIGPSLSLLLPARTQLNTNGVTQSVQTWDTASWDVRGQLVPSPALDEYSKKAETRRAPEERVALALSLA